MICRVCGEKIYPVVHESLIIKSSQTTEYPYMIWKSCGNQECRDKLKTIAAEDIAKLRKETP